jgi:protein-S-isoprenylcysteine O-methyltransferase Ste14
MEYTGSMPKRLYTHRTYTTIALLLAFGGVFLVHVLHPIRLFYVSFTPIIGAFLLIIGTILIFWAEAFRARHISEGYHDKALVEGPYAFTPHPVYASIFMMYFGLGFVLDSLILIFATIVILVIFAVWLIPYEDRIYADVFGGVK